MEAQTHSQCMLLDGKATALAVREDVKRRVAGLRAAGVAPGLAVVLVGEDPASQVYVRNKDRAASKAGFEVRTIRLGAGRLGAGQLGAGQLGAGVSQAELIGLVRELNEDAAVDGILVQLPLPAGLDADAVVRALDPAKDVDGLHPENVARLWRGEEGLVPCTPAGCIELLDRYGIEIEGRRAVVVGRSQLVGKPLAALLLARNATVTMAHSRTKDLPSVCREADLLVAAVGRKELIRGEWIRPGAVVLDVGINRTEAGKLVGDVEFEEACAKASALTPVPGGIGPMTIAMLLSNTALSAARRAGIV